MIVKRRRWLFARQFGLCCLQLTPACRARQGAMRLHSKGGVRGDFATRDHVLARSRKHQHAAGLILLACFECNTAKGRRDPAPGVVAIALALSREWFAISGDDGRRIGEIEAQVDAYRRRHEARAMGLAA